MDAGAMVLVVVVMVVVGLVLGALDALGKRPRPAPRTIAEIPPQDLVEARICDLITAYPELSDERIAQLAVDDLITMRLATPANMSWATPATVARLRRTMLRIALEREFRPAPRQIEIESTVVEAGLRCPNCQAKLPQQSAKCSACGNQIS